MARSPQLSLGLGVAALVLSGGLAAVGASSPRHAPGSTGESSTGEPSGNAIGVPATPLPGRSPAAWCPPSPLRPSPSSAGAINTRESPSVSEATRQSSVESSLRPLLLQPTLRAGVFGFDVHSGSFFDLSGDESFAAASLIKIPIAAALLVEADRGTVLLNESLELTPSDVAGGSGSLQYLPPGSRFTIARLGELMIRRSDNTATNMLITRLGGGDHLNDVFEAWGLHRTRVRSPLPDLAGTNRTSPRDLVDILEKAVSGGLVQPSSRELLLSWMRRSHVRSLLPAGVGPGAVVANKTGDIPGALGDAGYVEAPGGRRYFLAVQVERPRNNARAKELIRDVSRTVYESITGLRGQARARHDRAPGTTRRVGRTPSRRARSS